MSQTNQAHHTLPKLSTPAALGYCFVNWLIPGAGYLALGNKKRGACLFALINALVLIGVGLGGYIIVPSFDPKGETFNLVAILTYFSQAFHGGGWLGLQWLHQMAGSNESAMFHPQHMGIKPFSDLGIFHLIVAGALNYAATVRLYDLTTGSPELTESIPQREKEKAEKQPSKDDGEVDGT